MTSVPPLLPEQVLVRVYSLARRNGWSIVLIAGISALLQAAGRDTLGAITGLLAAGAGAMEVHGAGLLGHGQRRGTGWLIRAELLLLVIVIGYCILRLLHPNYDEMRLAFHATLDVPGMREKWKEAQRLGITEDQYLGLVHHLTFVVLAFATLAYQGGMALYYARRRRAVDLALSQLDSPE
jgi:hypothetical protein